MAEHEIRSLIDSTPLLRGSCLDLSLIFCRSCQSGQIVSDRIGGRSFIGLVVSGIVDVYSVALDGKDVQLNSLKAGDFFGICNLLVPEELETVLRCRTDPELLLIPKKELIEAMEQDASLALRYAAHCNQKIQFLIRRIELLTMQSCRGKLIEYLLSGQDEQGRISPGCSREELARHLGVSRAALFRELSALTNQGLLSHERGIITLLDQKQLEQILFRSA